MGVHDKLLGMLENFHPLTEELKNDFRIFVKEQDFEKGQYLLKKGSVCEHMHFIQEGMVQCFEGTKFNKNILWYMIKNEIPISKTSFYLKKESNESIIAVEDTTVLSISREDLDELYSKHVEFNINGRKLTEHYHVKSLLKTKLLSFKSPDDRYLHFQKERPDLIARLSQKEQAAFIQVTEETICRVIAKQKKNNSKNKQFT